MTTLDTPLAKAAGVGPKPAKVLADAFGMATVRDLVYHFPRRYAERGELTDIASLQLGEEVTIVAQVQRSTTRPMSQRKGWIVDVLVGDASGKTLSLTFFTKAEGQARWRASELSAGTQAMFAGTVSAFQGRRQLTHPEYVLLDKAGTGVEEFAAALIPVYPATKELRSWQIANILELVLSTLDPPADPMPAALRSERSLLGLAMALQYIHRPQSWEQQGAAKKRLKWDEAFAVQVSLVQRKLRAAAWPAVPRPPRPDGLLAAFDASMPFTLTAGQVAVGIEISGDLAGPIRCTGCCRARSARARPCARCAACSSSSTPAPRRPSWPRPRSWPRSTTAACASCSARWGGPASWTRPTRPPRSCW